MENNYQYVYVMGLCGYLIRVENNEESVAYRWDSGTSRKPYEQHAKIRYGKNNEPYFLVNGRRIYLSECVRIENLGGTQ